MREKVYLYQGATLVLRSFRKRGWGSGDYWPRLDLEKK
jgi:hypothetical protein